MSSPRVGKQSLPTFARYISLSKLTTCSSLGSVARIREEPSPLRYLLSSKLEQNLLGSVAHSVSNLPRQTSSSKTSGSCDEFFSGRYRSGQTGRTVNPLALPSKVQVLPGPPLFQLPGLPGFLDCTVTRLGRE